MILKPYKGKWPQIHPNAWIAENATIIGDVTIEEHASIWYGAVLRADHMPIRVGKNTNIQDLVLCHGDGDAPVVIGDNCTIGHCAIVHGCVIEDHSLILAVILWWRPRVWSAAAWMSRPAPLSWACRGRSPAPPQMRIWPGLTRM